jgi:hypothetical protein
MLQGLSALIFRHGGGTELETFLSFRCSLRSTLDGLTVHDRSIESVYLIVGTFNSRRAQAPAVNYISGLSQAIC